MNKTSQIVDGASMAVSSSRAFQNISDPVIFQQAIAHLRNRDPRLRRIIDKHGAIEFKTSGEMFESLVKSIIGQQVSGYAANAIIARVRALYESGNLTPKSVYRTRRSALRDAGISPQKLRYLRDLSKRVVKKQLDLQALTERPDEELVESLDQVLGIGPWTVHMILIFTLGRPDVLPVDDFGIKKAIQEVYSLSEIPRAESIHALAKKWHPYCSVASLYLWRHKDTVQPVSEVQKKKREKTRRS